MRPQIKPDYREMEYSEYMNQVFESIENKLTEPGAGLLCLGFSVEVVGSMIQDACARFRYLNLSPNFTACQIIELLTEVNSRQTN